MVALRVIGDLTPANNGVFYLLTDHLGSTSVTANGTTGALVSELRYKPWGETRWSSGTTPTSKHFTGQVDEGSALGGLYFYNARMYLPSLGRFVSADTDVPASQGPQGLNRYSYVYNSPLNFTDPSGHDPKNDYGESMNDDCDYAGIGCPDSNSIGQIAKYYRHYFPKAWKNRGEWQFGAEPRDFEAGRAEAVQLGVEWLTGTGPADRHYEFGPGDPFTTELKNYDHNTDKVLPNVVKNLESGNYKLGEAGDSLSGLEGIPKFIKNYAASMTLGECCGNIAAAYLGGYAGKYTVLQVNEAEGVAVVQFDITNESTAESGFRPPIIGYGPLWHNTVGGFENWLAAQGPGPMKTTTQHIQWTYAVEFGH
jgi:RHS repeat-associated protein